MLYIFILDVSGVWFGTGLVLAFLGHVLGIQAEIPPSPFAWPKSLMAPQRKEILRTRHIHAHPTFFDPRNIPDSQDLVTSHSSRQFQLKHLEMLQIIIIPQYLPQLVLLLAFENQMHSLCLFPSTIWIWSRTSNWAELSASLPVRVLFRNRCGLWCVDESKDHSLSGIGRHHHALEQHFVYWCFCHDHAACKTALGSVA